MNNQTNMSGGTTKMKAKDFITLGIFTVLFFAVVMVCIFASAATVASSAKHVDLPDTAATAKSNAALTAFGVLRVILLCNSSYAD